MDWGKIKWIAIQSYHDTVRGYFAPIVAFWNAVKVNAMPDRPQVIRPNPHRKHA